MWMGVLWARLRVAMWITHVGGKFRHGLLEKSLTVCSIEKVTPTKRNISQRESAGLDAH